MTDPVELNLQRPVELNFSERGGGVSSEAAGSGVSFADMLSRAVNSVDASMKASEQGVQDFIAGETDNIHDVMISMQRAQISFQMMVEVRNKAIEAYHELSRMQI